MTVSIGKLLVLFVAAVALLAVGCDGGSSVNDSGVNPSSFGSDEFAVLGAEDAFAGVEDGTLDGDMRMDSPFHGGLFRRHQRHPGHPGSHLRPVFEELDITREQLSQIREVLRAHRQVVVPLFVGLIDVNRDILVAANQLRQAIVASYLSAQMTVGEALVELAALNEQTREEIRNNPENAPYVAELCAARSQLFDSIRAILTAEQQTKWDNWAAGISSTCGQ